MEDDDTSQSHTVIVLSDSEDDFHSSWPGAAHSIVTVHYSLETSVVKIEKQVVKVRTCII